MPVVMLKEPDKKQEEEGRSYKGSLRIVRGRRTRERYGIARRTRVNERKKDVRGNRRQ